MLTSLRNFINQRLESQECHRSTIDNLASTIHVNYNTIAMKEGNGSALAYLARALM